MNIPVDIKPRPNHGVYIQALRAMTPEQRLKKAFELTAFTRDLFRNGLRERFPGKSKEELERLYRERLDKCHNQNW